MTVLGYCPACDKLVNIAIARVGLLGRPVWRPVPHGNDKGHCPSGDIR